MVAARPVSDRRARVGATATAWVNLGFAGMTVVDGYWMADGAAGDDRLGAAVWYGALAAAGAALLVVVAVALLRVRRAAPPLAVRLTRTALVSYWAIGGLVVAAGIATAAGAALSLVVMIPAVGSIIGAPSSLWYLKNRAAAQAG